MYGNELVVQALLIAHAHGADGTCPQQDLRGYLLLSQHEHIERIAIFAVGARHEAIVCRVVDGAVKDTVHPQQASRFVELVFDL